MSAQGLDDLRGILLDLGRQAFAEKKIDRLDFLYIRYVTRPRVWRHIDRMTGDTVGQHVADMILTMATSMNTPLPAGATVESIDWATLLEFIKEILPILVEMLPLLIAVI